VKFDLENVFVSISSNITIFIINICKVMNGHEFSFEQVFLKKCQ